MEVFELAALMGITTTLKGADALVEGLATLEGKGDY